MDHVTSFFPLPLYVFLLLSSLLFFLLRLILFSLFYSSNSSICQIAKKKTTIAKNLIRCKSTTKRVKDSWQSPCKSTFSSKYVYQYISIEHLLLLGKYNESNKRMCRKRVNLFRHICMLMRNNLNQFVCGLDIWCSWERIMTECTIYSMDSALRYTQKHTHTHTPTHNKQSWWCECVVESFGAQQKNRRTNKKTCVFHTRQSTRIIYDRTYVCIDSFILIYPTNV